MQAGAVSRLTAAAGPLELPDRNHHSGAGAIFVQVSSRAATTIRLRIIP